MIAFDLEASTELSNGLIELLLRLRGKRHSRENRRRQRACYLHTHGTVAIVEHSGQRGCGRFRSGQTKTPSDLNANHGLRIPRERDDGRSCGFGLEAPKVSSGCGAHLRILSAISSETDQDIDGTNIVFS